jgi:DNA-binding response OmpR family regulator
MANKKILVVDDEPYIVRMLETRLRSNGYDVVAAMDGMEALDMARTEKPDLIILDVMLPKMDGYKVCAMLKFDMKHANIPIIMLSARAHETDVKMGDDLGVEAYIVKPFDSKELMEKVDTLLNRQN